MTDKPILFRGDMVRAQLGGAKTETRRLAWSPAKRPHRYSDHDGTSDCKYGCGAWMGPFRSGAPDGIDPFGACPKAPPRPSPWQKLKPGDRLWVRERTMCAGHNGDRTQISVAYDADGDHVLGIPFPDRLTFKPEVGKCLSMGCYREASRLTWIVGAVRIEPLQAITREDAAREGMCWTGFLKDPPSWFKHTNWPEQNYKALWIAMHGIDSWRSNPDLVVITASAVIKGNIDAVGG